MRCFFVGLCVVGVSLGSCVGVSVGVLLGSCVGVSVGDSVGCSVGTPVGSSVDGAPVGCALDGWYDKVGAPDGASLAVTVGLSVSKLTSTNP